jgi:uracil-DNA glycosylase family 4
MGINNSEELNAELKRQADQLGVEYIVGGDGPVSADIAIVGESPGANEVQQGIPFSGRSGGVLFSALAKQCGLRRHDFYLTNLIKRPVAMQADLDESRFKVQKPEFEAWRYLLEEELKAMPNLKYVVVLGNHALLALCGFDHVSKWRGSVLDGEFAGKKLKFIVMVNPAAVLYEPRFQPIFQLDCAKLNKVLKGQFVEYKVNHLINPTFREAFEWLDKMEREKKPVGFDIEVTSGETACVGFANDPHEGMCINFRTEDAHQFSPDEEARLYRKIQRVLAHPDVQLVAQNGNFDSYWLWFKDRIRVKPIWFDTMLGHHTLYPLFPHDLGFITSQYTNHPYYKDDGKLWKEGTDDIDSYWRYNVKDCCITLGSALSMIKELEAQNLMQFYRKQVAMLQPELSRMTVLGVLCDMKLREELNAELSKQLDEIEEDWLNSVRIAANDESLNPNPRSHKQLRELLYGKLGLPSYGSKPSADAKNRERLLAHPLTPESVQQMLAKLNHYAVEKKFHSTYVAGEVDYDNRIRCDYKQTGVRSAPGRLSSAATLWGTGTNLQNQPERAQKMFIADEGYELSYTDGSQAEARLVARIANVRGLLENFERAKQEAGFDVHRANAARIFKKPYDEIPEYDRDPETGVISLRYLGKRCVHGLNYRMGADKLAEVCGISRAQANAAYFSYHRAFPEIKQWWDTTLAEVRQTGQLLSPLGRRLILLGIDPRADSEDLDSVIAFRPQSTVGDWVGGLIFKCHNDPRWPKTARIILNIHDAVIAQNKPEDGPLVRAIMKYHAEQPIPTPQGEVVIPFEFKKSVPDELGFHRWSNLVKVKGENVCLEPLR